MEKYTSSVVVGSNSREKGHRYEIQNVYANPEHRSGDKIVAVFHDIGLVKTNNDIEFSSTVQPIKLWTKSHMPYDVFRVAAWGNTDLEGTISPLLYEINPYQKIACPGHGVERWILCLFEKQRGLAPGDSGASIVLDKGGVPYSVAVAAIAPNRENFDKQPCINVLVSRHMDFIRKTTGLSFGSHDELFSLLS